MKDLEDPSTETVRMGIVGVGGMGGYHAKAFAEGRLTRTELTAVCDVSPAALEKFPDAEGFTDHRKMFRSGLVDAVLVATPHYAHTPLTIDAFKAGLHVLCEKPMAVDKADCERMLKARKRGEMFGIMLQQRSLPTYRKMKELIDGGALGRLTRVNWIITDWFRTNAYYASGGWRATWAGEGGGVLVNQCPHNLDLLQWLCGMPTRVRAFCGFGKWHDIEVEDEVTAYLEYANGATGVFVASTAEAPGTNRLEICGDFGKLVLEGDALSFKQNQGSMLQTLKTSTRGFGGPEAWDVTVPITGPAGGHAALMQNFIDAILDGEPLIAPAAEAINQVELANAMIYSGATGKPVDLPMSGATYKRFLNKLIAESKAPRTTSSTLS